VLIPANPTKGIAQVEEVTPHTLRHTFGLMLETVPFQFIIHNLYRKWKRFTVYGIVALLV